MRESFRRAARFAHRRLRRSGVTQCPSRRLQTPKTHSFLDCSFQPRPTAIIIGPVLALFGADFPLDVNRGSPCWGDESGHGLRKASANLVLPARWPRTFISPIEKPAAIPQLHTVQTARRRPARGSHASHLSRDRSPPFCAFALQLSCKPARRRVPLRLRPATPCDCPCKPQDAGRRVAPTHFDNHARSNTTPIGAHDAILRAARDASLIQAVACHAAFRPPITWPGHLNVVHGPFTDRNEPTLVADRCGSTVVRSGGARCRLDERDDPVADR